MTINDFEIVNDEIKKYYGTDKVLELPKSIKSIGVEAFKNCFDIEKIILNEGIKKIDKQAFVNCANLKSVNIPNSLTDIDPTAFMYANNIIEFIVSDDNQYYKAIKGSLYSKDESVLLFYANGLTKTSFTVPNSVYYIRDYAFFANKTLKKVIIGSNTKWIGNYAFCESKLESVKLSKWLSTICTGSFQFTNLKKIEIPCNVTSICENAFLQCPAKKIFLPSTLLSVATGGLMVSEVPTIFFSGDKENWDLITLYDNAIVPNASVKIIGRKNKWSEKELKIYQQENNIETNAKKQLKDFVIEEGILKEDEMRTYATMDEDEVPNFEDKEDDEDIEKLPTLYLHQTLRSGQTITSDGNIVVIGDANPGSEIVARGDVTVWGVLGGIAQAGSHGNANARIRALKMNAIQLRIANCYARRVNTENIPFVQKSPSFTPEEAYIDGKSIVITTTYESKEK